jgi:hypothetical protein
MSLHALRGFQDPCARPELVFRTSLVPELEVLLNRGARERIASLARAYPFPAQALCYECRLGADPRVDYALCLLPGFDEGYQAELEELRVSSSAWRRCVEFLRAWQAPESGLLPRLPFVCLAFDEVDQSRRADPCISLCIDRSFFARRYGVELAEADPASEVLALVGECCQRLLGQPIPAAVEERLRRCIGGAARAVHVSFMLSRSPPSIKLDVLLPRAKLAEYLSEIRYPFDPNAVAARIAEWMPWAGSLQLNLVLSGENGGALEVELLTRPGEADALDRYRVLELLEGAGLALPEKARALRHIWDEPLIASADGLRLGRNWYLKLRFVGLEPSDVKAYVAHMPQPGRTGPTTAPGP